MKKTCIIINTARGNLVDEDDWLNWPQAEIGQHLRVIQAGTEYIEYTGFGPFGDGRFSAEEKGISNDQLVGEVEIIDVVDGLVTTAEPIPTGSHIYLVEAPSDWTQTGAVTEDLAGLSGFGFARVTLGAAGERFVPHFEAVDVVSDNRLLPQQSFTTNHQFAVSCDAPQIKAQLLYRFTPPHLDDERGWSHSERIMVEVAK